MIPDVLSGQGEGAEQVQQGPADPAAPGAPGFLPVELQGLVAEVKQAFFAQAGLVALGLLA
ncbi:hypothetical protein D3C80_2145470 [compost metagenome]